MVITPEIALAGLHFVLGLVRGDQRARVRSTLDLNIVGAAKRADLGWEKLPHTLTVREGRENVYRLFLPADVCDQKVALMEGSLYSGLVGKRPGPLGRLAGIGAPLVVRTAPYYGEDLCRLADAVVDHGTVHSVEPAESDCALNVRLIRPIHPGKGHQLICWIPGQGVEFLGGESIDSHDEGRVWRFPCTAPDTLTRAIGAIAYQGIWRGSGWCSGLDEILGEIEQGTMDARQTSALVRWCHLPLLQPSEIGRRPVLETFFRKHAADVLAVWLFDRGLEVLGLRFDDDADHSRAAWAGLRALFGNWQPSADHVQAIISLFQREVENRESLVTITKLLLPQDPLLAGRLIFAHLKAKSVTPSDRKMASQYVPGLLREAADLPAGASEKQVRERQMGALDQAAETMMRVDAKSGVDSNFVKVGIADPAVNALQNGDLKPREAENLAVALQFASFRQYLGMRVLEKVATLI